MKNKIIIALISIVVIGVGFIGITKFNETKKANETKPAAVEVENENNDKKILALNTDIQQKIKDDLKNNKGKKRDKNIDEKKYTGHDWIDEKINEKIDEIDEKDLEKGLVIAEKIDDDVVLEYLDEGLTQDEGKKLKEYLTSEGITEEEIKTLSELAEKYKYILE